MKLISGYRLAAVALLAATPHLVGAQSAKSIGTPSATPDHSFGLIGGVRELADGRVLVADPIEKTLMISDQSVSQFRTVGREGAGPGEYKQPDGVWPLPADASLLVDLGNARLMEFDNQLRFGKTQPIVIQDDSGLDGMSFMLISGVDAAGNLYYRGGSPGQDSLNIYRYNRSTGANDKLATIKGPEVKTVTSGGPNDRSQSMRQVPLSASDGWAVAPSGQLYLVRAADYHVEVLGMDGRVKSGEPVKLRPIAITDADKEEWNAKRQRNGGIAIGVENVNGQRSISMERGRSRGQNLDDLPWPETKPAFDAGELWVDGKHRLWVRRHVAANSPWVYDIFSTDGNRLDSVTLAPDSRVVGMGDASVFVARFDADDLQHLERYELPL